MYKTRLSEEDSAGEAAGKLKRTLFLTSTNISAIVTYWSEHVTPTKDQWNKDFYYLHAQARVLFTPVLADTLLVYEENLPVTHDPVKEKLDEATYKRTIPGSLHDAFVDTHATLYYLMTKCKNQ